MYLLSAWSSLYLAGTRAVSFDMLGWFICVEWAVLPDPRSLTDAKARRKRNPASLLAFKNTSSLLQKKTFIAKISLEYDAPFMLNQFRLGKDWAVAIRKLEIENETQPLNYMRAH
jgi:hypothetical protein